VQGFPEVICPKRFSLAIEFIVKYIRARNFLPMKPVKQNLVARLFLGAKVLVWLGRRLKTSENASLPGSLRHE
jgi:hypothetical protein